MSNERYSRVQISVKFYPSTRTAYRIRKLRREIARRGVSILDGIMNAAIVAGVLLTVAGGMAADNESIAPTFWMMTIGLGLIAAAHAAKKI